jgi:hypothetical protein
MSNHDIISKLEKKAQDALHTIQRGYKSVFPQMSGEKWIFFFTIDLRKDSYINQKNTAGFGLLLIELRKDPSTALLVAQELKLEKSSGKN